MKSINILDVPPRILKKIYTVPESGCWLWSANSNEDGYGRIWWGNRLQYSHRVLYEYFIGPIGKGLEIDHLCRNPYCCNPEHLEVVTPHENYVRSNPSSFYKNKTHCANGHAFNSENTFMERDGARTCITCRREAGRKFRRKRRLMKQETL